MPIACVVAHVRADGREGAALGVHRLGPAFEHQIGGGQRGGGAVGIDPPHARDDGRHPLRLQRAPGLGRAPAQVDPGDGVAGTGTGAGAGDGDASASCVAGETPAGRRTARAVTLTPRGPCLRARQGSVPVSASAQGP